MICERFGKTTPGSRSERVLKDIALEMVHYGARNIGNGDGKGPAQLSVHGSAWKGSTSNMSIKYEPVRAEPINLTAGRSTRFSNRY
jgi:hypothetical protein